MSNDILVFELHSSHLSKGKSKLLVPQWKGMRDICACRQLPSMQHSYNDSSFILQYYKKSQFDIKKSLIKYIYIKSEDGILRQKLKKSSNKLEISSLYLNFPRLRKWSIILFMPTILIPFCQNISSFLLNLFIIFLFSSIF